MGRFEQGRYQRVSEVDQREIGQELYKVQLGLQPKDFKPMKTVGAGIYELRVSDDNGAFRVIYVAKLKEAVYVLHGFQKKTQKTSKLDLELAAHRYKLVTKRRS